MIDKDRIPPSHMDYEKFNQAMREWRRTVDELILDKFKLKQFLEWLVSKERKKEGQRNTGATEGE